MPRLSALLLLALLSTPASAQSVGASPFAFGSADNPTEVITRTARGTALRVDAFGGPSYIGVRWRTGFGIDADAASGPLSLGLSGRLRIGDSGLYDDDVDETYDLLRVLRYARFEPATGVPVYARVGPIANTTLGTGHLVHSFQTTTAWDERTVGAEVGVQLPAVRLVGFADDVRLGGVVGGRATVAPFGGSLRPRLRSLEVGATAVTDLGLPAELATTALSLDARFDYLRVGDFALSPFVSYARFLEYGDSFGAGAEFASTELIGLGRVRATLGVFRSGSEFVPGYFNAFYSVSNPEARIWNADAFYRDVADETVGTPLAEAQGGTSVYFGLRALVFRAFELATYVRRDYSDDPLSEAGLRLVVSPNGGDPLRLVFDVQRQGRTSFGSLFGDFRDQNTLTFHLDYAVTGPAWIFIRSRYGFTRVADGPDGTERYLVERRFEPFVGVRLLLQ
ncbi:MAG: hypothetical protein ABJF88_03445 [Rhodothermales bacterium]